MSRHVSGSQPSGRKFEVSSRVNLVKNDDAACAMPVVREAADGAWVGSRELAPEATARIVEANNEQRAIA